nr:MAG TPA: hypothetical protein [Caudoviricetes sp.]
MIDRINTYECSPLAGRSKNASRTLFTYIFS